MANTPHEQTNMVDPTAKDLRPREVHMTLSEGGLEIDVWVRTGDLSWSTDALVNRAQRALTEARLPKVVA